MAVWQLQQAKAQLSEVVKMALEIEPQQITLHGKPAVVVIAQADYNRLTQARVGLVDLMRTSPFIGVELDLERDKSLTRAIKLKSE